MTENKQEDNIIKYRKGDKTLLELTDEELDNYGKMLGGRIVDIEKNICYYIC